MTSREDSRVSRGRGTWYFVLYDSGQTEFQPVSGELLMDNARYSVLDSETNTYSFVVPSQNVSYIANLDRVSRPTKKVRATEGK